MLSASSDELHKLNDYFKDVMDMIPPVTYAKAFNTTKRPVEEAIDINARKINAKRQKMNPRNFKTFSELNEESSDDDEDNKLNLKKRGKPVIRKSDCSIEELQSRLRQKMAALKMQRESHQKSTKHAKSTKKKDDKAKKEIVITKPTRLLTAEEVIKPKNNEGPNKTDAIKTKDGKIVYSKFDFGQMVGNAEKSLGKKYKLPTGKNYKAILSKVMEDKEKLNQLKLDNPEKAAALIEKTSWKKAAAKAEGIKLKDDPVLLKKSLKRKESLKKRSAKKWKERNDAVAEKIQERQDKRKENIKKRVDHKKAKKIMKRMKKRKGVPGF